MSGPRQVSITFGPCESFLTWSVTRLGHDRNDITGNRR
jgi:hypothetical protein